MNYISTSEMKEIFKKSKLLMEEYRKDRNVVLSIIVKIKKSDKY